MILVWLGCTPKVLPPPADAQIDVAVVPGCPAEDDGALSFCLIRRVLWAQHLYEQGVVDRFIVSGAAVHNPYPEWQGLYLGLVEVGVPAERILTETQALHTDENLGYSWAIARDQGFEHVAVASDTSHVETACKLLEKWEMECLGFPANYDIVHAMRREAVFTSRVEPVDDWRHWKEVEQDRGWRAPSWWVYSTAGVREMPSPALPEPSLSR